MINKKFPNHQSCTPNDSGSVLASLVLVMPFLILMAAFFLSLAANSYRLARADQLRIHAQFATDAGIDRALKEVNINESWSGTDSTDPDWSGVGNEIELQDANNVRTTYEVTVTTTGSESKTVRSIGRSYAPSASTTPSKIIEIESTLRPVGTGFSSIVTGVGGLYMSNSAKILGGDVKVNGEVKLSNTAQIGLSTNSVKMDVANQNCPDPPDSNYPRICDSGESTEPVTINHLAHIYGDVSANNQTSTAGMSNNGLVASSGVVEEPLPTHDRAAQQAAVASTITGTDASCTSGNTTTETWPANVKIEGDVEIGGQCTIIAEGDVWITGTLLLRNQGKIQLKEDTAITQPDIMVDGGPISVTMNNSSEFASNSFDVGFRVITYWSMATCSPDCTDVTGTDLYDSRDTTTIIMNNFSQAPNTVLYAKWSRVEVGNAGAIGALIGQTVNMTNNSTVTFGTSAGGSDPRFWVIDGYRRVF